MRRTLTPYDPTDLLLTAIATLLRDGPANCAAINPDPPAWAAGDPCPAGHYLFPAGTHLYPSDTRDTAVHTPMAVHIGVVEDLKEKSEEVDGFWNLPLEIKLAIAPDAPVTTLRETIHAIQRILFRPIILDDTTVQQPQTRLNTDTLYLSGTRWQENFTGLSITDLTDGESNHPTQSILVSITCAHAPETV